MRRQNKPKILYSVMSLDFFADLSGALILPGGFNSGKNISILSDDFVYLLGFFTWPAKS